MQRFGRRWLALVLAAVVVLSHSVPAHAASRDYVYDLSGRLSRVMDAEGNLVKYGYDEVGNIVKIERDKVDPSLVVLGTLPDKGGAGDLVTIQGRGFAGEIAGNEVQIGGVTATVVSVDESGRKLVVKVPWDAESGPISITVGGKTVTGEADFTVIRYGDVGIRGTTTPGATASYPIELVQGQSVAIRLADEGANAFYPELVLKDPTGKVVDSGSGGTVAAIGYTAVVSGTFEMVVGDRSGQNVVGSYVLYYSVAPGSNEGGALNANEPLDGTIDLGDLDSFTFEAKAGESVLFRVADTAQTAFHPYLQVFGPAGNLIQAASGADVAGLGFKASVAGSYTALVFDYSSGYASTGTYEFYFAKAPGSTDGGALDANAPADGSLELGDMDSYSLSLKAGEYGLLRVVDSAQGSLTPYVQVYDPSGALVDQASGAIVAGLSFKASVTGTYTAVVFDYSSGYASIGPYRVYFAKAPGSMEGGALDPTTPMDGTIDVGDMDSYTFAVTAGAGVQLRVADVAATSFVPYLMVFDPNGALVDQVSGAAVAASSFAPSVSGTYTAVVFDSSSGYASSGTYKLYFAQAPGSNEGGALSPTAPLDGTIDLGDLDSYTFDLTAGMGVQLRVADVAGTVLAPYLVVYDPSGAIVATNWNYDVAAISFKAAVSGTFTALVFDHSSGWAGTGSYKLYFTKAPGSNEHGALDATDPIDGSIDLGDLDSYTFAVTSGSGIQLRVADVAQTAFAPYLAVYDPNGALVAANWNYDVAAISFTPSVAGTFTAVIFDNSSGYASTGTYKLYFSKAPGSSDGGALDPNNPVDGTIDLGDLDAYTFSMTANVGVQLRVADVAQTTFAPYLAVYDPSGTLVAANWNYDVAAVTFTPSVAGTFTAVVFDTSSGYASSGTYKIYFTKAPGSGDGGELALDVPVDGTVDLGDLDSYTMTLAAGAGAQLRVADVAQTAFAPYLAVYGPSGALVDSNWNVDVAAVAFNAPVAGQYTAVIYDNSSGHASSGSYKLYYSGAPGSNEGGVLPVGTTVDGAVERGDLDSFTFTANAGDKPMVTVTDVNDSAFTPRVVIYNPAGTIVANVNGLAVAAPTFTAAVTGSYTVLVYDSSAGSASTGDYTALLTMN